MTDRDVQRIRQNIDSRVLLYSQLKQSGADPSLLFEILEGIIERKDWEMLHDTDGAPVGSFTRFIESPPPTGCGMPADKLLKLLQLEHRYEKDTDYKERMAHLRGVVQQLFVDEIPAIGKHGNNQYKSGDDISSPLNVNKGSTSREYIIARLKRDNPELAKRVTKGEISASKAATEAGFKKERIGVPNDDMQKAAKALKAKLSPEQVGELIQYLLAYESED